MHDVAQRLRFTRPGLRAAAAYCALFIAQLLIPSVQANTSVFANAGSACQDTSAAAWCRDLSAFGVLTGLNDSFSTNGGITLNGGLGIQGTGTVTVSNGNLQVNDIVDFANPVKTGATCGTGGVNLCGAGKLDGVTINAGGGVNNTPARQNSTLLSAAATDLNNIENNFLANFTNSTTYNVKLPTANGTYNIETSAKSAGNNTYVYNTSNLTSAYSVAQLTFGCGGSVTACADDLLIIVLSSTSNITFSKNIVLNDGLTADQVLFYFAATSGVTFTNTGSAATTVALAGDFFFKSTQTLTLGGGANRNLTIDGRLYGGSIVDTNGGRTVTQTDAGLYTPEPATWAMLVGGIGGLFWMRRRRAQHSSPAKR